MINPKNFKNRLLAFVFLSCMALAAASCSQSLPQDTDNPWPINDVAGAANQTDHALNAQATPAAPAANSFRCYTLNYCRGNSIPGAFPTANACAELGGNSWTDRNGTCVPDIGE